eukprot:TRINITY_DN5121_c0_g1_i1.p1 TRINITY_DN5121_c0_g1~~TRINITY_DN5121_c0_g1_i1.p1  ORF type:complete len:124 (+),score=21.69 TRINITY_DN5121_c0_g1_i1:235-606(+)
MTLAGLWHFHPSLMPVYKTIMPRYLPAHEFLILLSGIIEAGVGILFIFPKYVDLAAWGTIATLIAIYPANFTWITDPQVRRKMKISLGFAYFRALLQLAFCFWAYQLTTLPLSTVIADILNRF